MLHRSGVRSAFAGCAPVSYVPILDPLAVWRGNVDFLCRMLVFYHARPSRRGVTGRRLHVVSELGFDISRTGYTVSLVPRDRLPYANALIEGANAIGEGIGPSVGGWLFDTLGVALSLLFDFVTYVCSSLLVLLTYSNAGNGRRPRHRSIRPGRMNRRASRPMMKTMTTVMC